MNIRIIKIIVNIDILACDKDGIEKLSEFIRDLFKLNQNDPGQVVVLDIDQDKELVLVRVDDQSYKLGKNDTCER